MKNLEIKMKKIPIADNENLKNFITLLFLVNNKNKEYYYYEITENSLLNKLNNQTELPIEMTVFFCYLKEFNYNLDFDIIIKDSNHKKDFIFVDEWFKDSYNYTEDSWININLSLETDSIRTVDENSFIKNLESLYKKMNPLKYKFNVNNK